MTQLHEVKKHLRSGHVYRRADLKQWSNAVDRHVQQLLAEGALTKLAHGLYYCPKRTVFGDAPPEDATLVKAFLKDDRFLLHSPNAYNALGVGTTQLYNETVVYNHKRHGRFDLDGRCFDFRVKPHFPHTLSEEFLLVDLVNNVNRVAEDTDALLDRVRAKVVSVDPQALARAAQQYGGVRARQFFASALADTAFDHAVQ